VLTAGVDVRFGDFFGNGELCDVLLHWATLVLQGLFFVDARRKTKNMGATVDRMLDVSRTRSLAASVGM
jgi:hypothetical protein